MRKYVQIIHSGVKVHNSVEVTKKPIKRTLSGNSHSVNNGNPQSEWFQSWHAVLFGTLCAGIPCVQRYVWIELNAVISERIENPKDWHAPKLLLDYKIGHNLSRASCGPDRLSVA